MKDYGYGGRRLGLAPAKREYGSARWQRLSKHIVERDGHRCYWCGGVATQGDHLTPTSHGGAMWDESNLVAACGPCNRARPAPADAPFFSPRHTLDRRRGHTPPRTRWTPLAPANYRQAATRDDRSR